MNSYLASMFLPVVLGIVAGVGYGMSAQYSNVSTSLGGQISQPLSLPRSLKD